MPMKMTCFPFAGHLLAPRRANVGYLTLGFGCSFGIAFLNSLVERGRMFLAGPAMLTVKQGGACAALHNTDWQLAQTVVMAEILAEIMFRR